MDYPKLRAVEAFPVEMNGQRLVCLRDPYKFSDRTVLLPPLAFFIVSLFDGEHSIRDIQEAFLRRYGEILVRENVEQVIRDLEGNFLLDGPAFRERKRKTEEEFRQADLRSAAHADVSYPGDPRELEKYLTGFFEDSRGPGLPNPVPQGPPLRGLIVPHIDLRAGGSCYAWGYRELAEREVPELFVILGTGHTLLSPFALTRKDFEIPLGVVETDREFVQAVAESSEGGLFRGEYAHKDEHSIEFQLLFLRHLLGGKHRFRIASILCGSFHRLLKTRQSPGADPEVGRFLESLGRAISSYPGRVCLVASVDLSHVGRRYGDFDAPTPDFLESVEREDRRLLTRVEQGDAEGFFDCIREAQDRYRVCGVSAIYSMLRILGGVPGRLLRYGRSAVDEENSAVSYASVAFG